MSLPQASQAAGRKNQQPIIRITEEEAAQLSAINMKQLSVSERVLVESNKEKNRISEVKVGKLLSNFLLRRKSIIHYVEIYIIYHLLHCLPCNQNDQFYCAIST